MKLLTDRFATARYRWVALGFIALGLAIVIIDNTVLVVAIPYILLDLHTTFDAIQWVVSGYSLIIATLLITMGRLGDIFGRKRIFLLGVVLFALGSLIASVSRNIFMLFLGEAFIEAFGAAMMLTTALAIIADEFRGSERAIAFGVWGSIAGASASVGPLLGGYLTTYFSWRWSFRINIIVALITLLGSVFIRESSGEKAKHFDWQGMFYSAISLFALVFAVIEGRIYGFWKPLKPLVIGSWHWPSGTISVIPIMFLFSLVSLMRFVLWEKSLEQKGRSPLLRPSIFRKKGFSMGLTTLMIVSFGQYGVFLVLPIFLQNALGMTAFQTGLVFLYTSVSVFIFGPVSGFIASKIHPRILVNAGMVVLSFGVLILSLSLTSTATGISLAPGLVLFGIGIGMASSQLNNLIISAIPVNLAGEASASSVTMRQIGSSVGSAIIGVSLAATLTASIFANITNDRAIPGVYRQQVMQKLTGFTPESLQTSRRLTGLPDRVKRVVKKDIDSAMARGARSAMDTALLFIVTGTLASFFIPMIPIELMDKDTKPAAVAGH